MAVWLCNCVAVWLCSYVGWMGSCRFVCIGGLKWCVLNEKTIASKNEYMAPLLLLMLTFLLLLLLLLLLL